MTDLTLGRDDLMPPQPGGMGAGLVMALLAHIGLVAALAFGVNWRTSEPEGIEAELWAAVPQVAAPRAAAPEPTPPRPVPPKPAPPQPKAEREPARPDPQIAIEKARREQLKAQQEEAKQEKEKQKRLQQEKDKAAALQAERKRKEDERKAQQIQAQREANLKRILGQAGAPAEGEGTAARTAGPSAGYAGRIKARIKPNIVFSDSIEANPEAEVEVRAAIDGTITSRRLLKSSGVKEWDEAVLRAIDRTEILPRDIDGRVPSPMVIVFKPRDF